MYKTSNEFKYDVAPYISHTLESKLKAKINPKKPMSDRQFKRITGKRRYNDTRDISVIANTINNDILNSIKTTLHKMLIIIIVIFFILLQLLGFVFLLNLVFQ